MRSWLVRGAVTNMRLEARMSLDIAGSIQVQVKVKVKGLADLEWLGKVLTTALLRGRVRILVVTRLVE